MREWYTKNKRCSATRVSSNGRLIWLMPQNRLFESSLNRYTVIACGVVYQNVTFSLPYALDSRESTAKPHMIGLHMRGKVRVLRWLKVNQRSKRLEVLEHQPDLHHDFKILFKWSLDVFLKIKLCFTFRCQMCLKSHNVTIINVNLESLSWLTVRKNCYLKMIIPLE